MMRQLVIVLLAAGLAGGPSPKAQVAQQRAAANDNRAPAGVMERDTLVLRMTVTPAEWHILSDSDPAFNVLAFAEEGHTPTIPGPLLRVRVGTPVQVRLRNPLHDTLIIRGFSERARADDSLALAPGSTNVIRFVARHAGTYLYWATLRRSATTTFHPRADLTLAGAIVVDPPGPIGNERIFVITQFADRDEAANAASSTDRHGTLRRQFGAINGKAWPHTERLQHAAGDSIRWRVINASQEAHPMHLHGFYFRVDS